MDDEDPASELYPEQLVAENIAEAVWLRLRRLTSSTLCQRVIEARNPSLPVLVLEKKGQEVASSVRSALAQKPAQALLSPPIAGPSTITYVGIYPHGQRLTAEYLNSFDLPIKNVRPEEDTATGSLYFIGDFTHASDKHRAQCLQTYKSGYCGTSIIVPFWGNTTDPFIIHFMTLYALSIIVRYLPSLWHEIEDGKLDHIRALIEHYVVIVDNVLPQLAVQRLTGRRLIAVQPGSLHGPV